MPRQYNPNQLIRPSNSGSWRDFSLEFSPLSEYSLDLLYGFEEEPLEKQSLPGYSVSFWINQRAKFEEREDRLAEKRIEEVSSIFTKQEAREDVWPINIELITKTVSEAMLHLLAEKIYAEQSFLEVLKRQINSVPVHQADLVS